MTAEDTMDVGEKAQLNILETTKACQQQNGLRQRDYQRYREYCARRLRRLRKVLDFKYASHRSPFQLQHVTAELAQKDARYLLIPLMNAERAWGYAMQLKDENQREGEDPRKRLHLVKRLSKAASWSAALRDLCSKAADDRTSLESEAYAAWMTGNMLLEKDEWQEAFAQFNLAKDIYGQLSQVGSPAVQILMKERVEEIEPSLRYCSYHVSREGGPEGRQEALKILKAQSAVGSDLLQSKIRKVLEQTRLEESDQASQLTWKGKSTPVRSEKVRIKLLEIRDQREELFKLLNEARASGNQTHGGGAVINSEDVSPLDAAYLEFLSVLDEASRVAREEQLRVGKQPQGVGAVSDKVASEFTDVLAYVKSVKAQVVMERNALYAEEMEPQVVGLFSGQEQPSGAQQPQDVVHMYDRALQNTHDLFDLFGVNQESDQDWEPWHKQDLTPSSLKAKNSLYTAVRSYYIAAWYANVGKWAEALALIQRGLDIVSETKEMKLAHVQDADRESLHAALDGAQKRLRTAHCLALSKAHLSKLGGSGDDAQLLVSVRAPPSETSAQTTKLEICALPPAIEALPSQPVVFDLAFTSLRTNVVASCKKDVSLTSKEKKTASRPSASTGEQEQDQPGGWFSSAKGWFSGRK